VFRLLQKWIQSFGRALHSVVFEFKKEFTKWRSDDEQKETLEMSF